MEYRGLGYAIASLLVIWGFISLVINLFRKKDRKSSIEDERSEQSKIKKCPLCAETIKLEAKKCRFCQHLFDPEEVDRQIQALSDAELHTHEDAEVKQLEDSSIIGSAFLGVLFGGFLGLILGGMIAILEWPREISIIVFIGGIIAGIIIMIRLAKKANKANKEST